MKTKQRTLAVLLVLVLVLGGLLWQEYHGKEEDAPEDEEIPLAE